MNLPRYIRGERKGEEARDVELEILRDSFLSDAISGFDASGAGQEFAKDIAELRKEIVSKMFVKRSRWMLWLIIIASVLLVTALVFVFLSYGSKEVKSSSGLLKTSNESNKTSLIEIERNNDVGSNSDFNKSLPIANEKDSTIFEDKTKSPQINSAVTHIKESVTRIDEDSHVGAETYAGTTFIFINTKDLADSTRFLTVPSIGLRKYNEFLSKACVLPEESERGDVTLSFKVNQYGRPSVIRVDSSPSKEANKEAIRLLNSGPEWHPTEERVSVTMRLR